MPSSLLNLGGSQSGAEGTESLDAKHLITIAEVFLEVWEKIKSPLTIDKCHGSAKQ